MILIAVLYAVFAAMAFINSKLMLTNPYPFFVSTLRALGSAFFLLGYAAIFKRIVFQRLDWSRKSWKDLILFGLCVHGLAMSGFSYSVQYIDPVKLCFIYAMNPFITAILQYFLHNETLTKRKIVGLVIGFFGLLPILLAAEHGAYKQVSYNLEMLGMGVCFVAMLFFSYGWIAIKRFLNVNPTSSIEMVNIISMSLGGLVSLLFFVISNQFDASPITLTSDFSFFMTAFIISSLLTYIIYAFLLKTFSATFIAFAGFLEPVFGLVYGVIFMGHPLTLGAVGALFVVFIGLFIFYREEIRTHKCDIKTDPNC